MSNLSIAFLVTLIAGLSTGIGSVIAFFAKRTNTKFLSVALGFSAGVMIYVSMVEMTASSVTQMTEYLGKTQASWISIALFFGGMILVALIDKFIPSSENPHEVKKVEQFNDKVNPDTNKLLKTGLMTALIVTLHNFPEGIATFASALDNPKLGILIAAAIAIHNIPEGIAVSLPVYYATGNRKQAFWLSFLSGISEPIGAVLGYLLLGFLFKGWLIGAMLSFVAGIMVFISIDELLPAAREYGEHHLAIYGVISGMAVMAISLLLL